MGVNYRSEDWTKHHSHPRASLAVTRYSVSVLREFNGCNRVHCNINQSIAKSRYESICKRKSKKHVIILDIDKKPKCN